MKRIAAVVALVALAACSGNFSTGTGMPDNTNGMPPMNGGTPMPVMDQNGLPPGASAKPSASPSAAGTATYPIDDAKKGFACPQLAGGYACTLSFNLPAPTPAPKRAKSKTNAKATATPSPTPTPTPTPTPSASASGSASPSPSPTPAVPTLTLSAQAPPKNAPKMVHVPANTLDTVPLMMVQLATSGDFNLDGWVNAQFTLPKTEVEGRGFALQLFQVTTHKKSVNYKPIWTFDKSTLSDTTLTFSFEPPKMSIAKGSTYTLVLYGDDKASPSASPSGSPAPSGTPVSSPSPAQSAAPAATSTP